MKRTDQQNAYLSSYEVWAFREQDNFGSIFIYIHSCKKLNHIILKYNHPKSKTLLENDQRFHKWLKGASVFGIPLWHTVVYTAKTA